CRVAVAGSSATAESVSVTPPGVNVLSPLHAIARSSAGTTLEVPPDRLAGLTIPALAFYRAPGQLSSGRAFSFFRAFPFGGNGATDVSCRTTQNTGRRRDEQTGTGSAATLGRR